MSRTVATLPAGSRITDYISLGVVARTFPVETVRGVLSATGKSSVRERDLPAHVVVYYVIALALYMQSSYREVLRCLLEAVVWLSDPSAKIRVAGNSGISQARTRLGWEPLRQLYEEVVRPIAQQSTRGAWYRNWRVVSLDGSTLDVADESANDKAFGRSRGGRGDSAFPQIRFVALLENGTHVLFGGQMGAYGASETVLAKAVLPGLRPGMLCLADRGFYGFALWKQAVVTSSAACMVALSLDKVCMRLRQWSGRHAAVAGQKGSASAVRKTFARWFLSQPDGPPLCVSDHLKT